MRSHPDAARDGVSPGGRAAGRDSLDSLVPGAYGDLRALAGRLLRHESSSLDLPPCALVHESYIRMVVQREPWRNRGHVMAIAARMMRRVIVDRARSVRADRRGGASRCVSLHGAQAVPVDGLRLDERAALAEALRHLRAVHPLAARVLELRQIAGLTAGEVAGALSVSPSTVRRGWNAARTCLAAALSAGEGAPPRPSGRKGRFSIRTNGPQRDPGDHERTVIPGL